MSNINDYCTRKGLIEESICPPHCPRDIGIVRNANKKSSSNRYRCRNGIRSNHQLAKNNHLLPKMKTVSTSNCMHTKQLYVGCKQSCYPTYHKLDNNVPGIHQCRRCPVCGCARCRCCHNQ